MGAPDADALGVVPIGVVAGGRTAPFDDAPWMTEFAPRREVRQPAWASELMRGDW